MAINYNVFFWLSIASREHCGELDWIGVSKDSWMRTR